MRFVGEAVAAVVAETRDQARDAAEAIDVDYEPLPAVVDVEDAIAPGAPLVWPEATGNVACEARHGNVAATRRRIRRAPRTSSRSISSTSALHPAPIEPRATLASFDAATGRITLRVSCQTPTGVRDELCDEVLGIAPDERARRRRRRRRRLRHEDDALRRGRRRRVLRAQARSVR